MSVLEETAHLATVPIDIGVELGRCQMTLSQVMSLAEGSVIKLPRSAGDNIDILAGGHLIGSGEVVIIEDRFGVRITDFREIE